MILSSWGREEVIHEILDLVQEAKRQGVPRQETLRQLARLRGCMFPASTGPSMPMGNSRMEPLYPDLSAHIEKRVAEDLGALPFPRSLWYPTPKSYTTG